MTYIAIKISSQRAGRGLPDGILKSEGKKTLKKDRLIERWSERNKKQRKYKSS